MDRMIFLGHESRLVMDLLEFTYSVLSRALNVSGVNKAFTTQVPDIANSKDSAFVFTNLIKRAKTSSGMKSQLVKVNPINPTYTGVMSNIRIATRNVHLFNSSLRGCFT